MEEQHFNDYDEYILKTSAAGSTFQLSEAEALTKFLPHKIDPKAPVFKVFYCHSIPIELDYCQVAQHLLDMLIIVYNKMYDNQFLNNQVIANVEKID